MAAPNTKPTAPIECRRRQPNPRQTRQTDRAKMISPPAHTLDRAVTAVCRKVHHPTRLRIVMMRFRAVDYTSPRIRVGVCLTARVADYSARNNMFCSWSLRQRGVR